MKKILLSFITIFFIPINILFSQMRPQMSFNFKDIDKIQYNCKYKLIFKPDSTQKDYILSEQLSLLIGQNGISCFLSTSSLELDSLMSFSNPSGDRSSMRGLFNKFFRNEITYRIFKNYPKKNNLMLTNMAITGFVKYEEPIDIFDWELQDEQKIIEGYNCQKATTNFRGRKFIAWFCPEIPISEGPYKFNGLPGLIMEISDTKEDYRFIILEFRNIENQNKNIQILNEEKLVNLSYKDYLDWLENNKKMLTQFSQRDRDNRHRPPSEDREKMMKEYTEKEKRKNNPIELLSK